ncbi:bacillithiol system protein YtxJ [Tenacibaculum mesophilum]|uniref:Bacillithiol system redox-active protein YtxJ n=2 Tax=Tenacibaculum TaxID=104267 RepID=A0ABM7CD53_9FLAO|nr:MULTISPECIES: bacillithiol system redox-active protein YtxJ [Tenacibaculum]AZJ31672.1 bacillithiol system redox-active protein YtxJ [Tenacibaculum mesophilum]MCO7185617.1 bacillithiol system redox-active protein YtxJ [Tenacibaculum sp. XPcli2-G]QFS26925.1 bacillithiol system redox-active protein YtxJ [Tenacibaculum mesophilum]SHG02290.1 bacillithiol system protein YtxJ [Tenacibaculum mesophilum]BFF37661.1 bacillithiol system redox-active protein YtxJ [Tenacibaculum mesophilum]
MGVLNTIFGRKDKNEEGKESFINWTPLTSVEQIKEIKELSNKQPIAIFKHSTRCGISSMVIKRFVNSFDEELKDFKVYYLDLLSYRDVSNEIGYTFQVLHQSPQLLVVKNGEVISHASHYDIARIDLKKI